MKQHRVLAVVGAVRRPGGRRVDRRGDVLHVWEADVAHGKGTVDDRHDLAITSSFHPDERTHIEPVRYGKGSNLMMLLTTVMTDGGGRVPRGLRWLGHVARHPGELASLYLGIGHWSERATIALVMQTVDSSVTVYPKRGWSGRFRAQLEAGARATQPDLDSGRQRGRPPDGRTHRRVSLRQCRGDGRHPVDGASDRRVRHRRLGGNRRGRPLPPHVRSPRAARGRRFGDLGQPRGQPGIDNHYAGGAGDVDVAEQRRDRPRPPLGASYQRLTPVPPRDPAVPAGAPAALRQPVAAVR